MRFLNKFLMWMVSWVVVATLLIFIATGALHFIRSYEQLAQKRPEATVTIPEGSNMYDIDRILSSNGIMGRGDFIASAAEGDASDSAPFEGRLFPDTYDFFLGSSATSVIQRMVKNFDVKAAPLFTAVPQDATSTKNAERDLILASLVQKEVASSTDEAMVAGILEKRLAVGMFLDVDATICYAKQQKTPTSTASCYPITAADLKMESPYNTYRIKGLPPTPIGNPGLEAITATLHPQSSTYWYYLSDPKTGKTIYAKTLAEQNANQLKYLGY